MGQMSPTWDSVSPFVIAELDDFCVCEREQETTGEDICVQDRFFQGLGVAQEDICPSLCFKNSPYIIAWKITASLLASLHLF